ncbi:MAG: hypothetical protein R2713_09690 [Ilumatobacteraceae bacterium]
MFWAVVLPAVVAIGVTSRGLRLPFATRPARIDWLGIALLVIGSSAILLLPIWGGDTYAWGSVQIVATAAVALVATVAFVAHERAPTSQWCRCTSSATGRQRRSSRWASC